MLSLFNGFLQGLRRELACELQLLLKTSALFSGGLTK